MSYSIAVDGPAGGGKSTIAKQIAENKGMIYVDTGALYRAIAVYVLRCALDISDERAVAESLCKAAVDLKYEEDGCHVLLNGEDITESLRAEEVSNAASVISRYVPVREKLLDLQRKLAEKYDVIMDGRDIGTVVLPGASLKIFLTASPAVRAKRRYNQLRETNRLEGRTLEEIQRSMQERDERDMNRKAAPLKAAEDAVVLDTSDMTLEEVKNIIISLLEEKIGS